MQAATWRDRRLMSTRMASQDLDKVTHQSLELRSMPDIVERC